MKVDAAYMDTRRRTPEEITELAREVVTNRVLVTNDFDTIRNGFLLLLSGIEFAPDVTKLIGALVGPYDSTTGQALNGTPIFTSMGFVHTDDMKPLLAEMRRMGDALGLPLVDASGRDVREILDAEK